MSEERVQFIRPPNSLKKAKVGSGPAKLDHELLAKAEAAIEKMHDHYADWADGDLTEMEARLAVIREADDQGPHIKVMFRHALDMKGQGGSFGYDMVTNVAGSLADFIEGRTELRSIDFEVVAAHVKTMRAVLAENVKGDGGETGKALMEGLHAMVAKAAAAAARG